MKSVKSIALVAIFLLSTMSSLATASQIENDLIEDVKDRLPSRDGRFASEDYGWWFSYGPDVNFDGMDDRLEVVISGAHESISTTSIIGSDGRKTVAIVVDFAWHPTEVEVEELLAVLKKHGWEAEGSWFQIMDSIDSIVVDHVPVSALWEIHAIESVVVVEMQNVMVPFLANANPATRIQPSEVYSGTVYDRGYTGEGIVIAVLDSGVDNEHRSLNDFDDQDDAPDLDPNSYDDQKWVAGFDATSQASNPDGSQDPDDGQGHGTHVAGIALGTGDSSRVHIGGAPGAYLVDVKVLTDSGGTNSQNSLNGIQWMINNRDTNWGDGAKGIQIGQMSFGSIGNVFDPNDSGDNGTGAEARLVNNATENGITCVVAAGNDGRNRIASPGSADGAITVGAIDDADSINRTDDFVASYSNYGPRESDSDNDDWDELKPDVTSYGSGMFSASAATGSSLPGTPRPMAEDGYESKDGTSMATPLVSGVVALMLQADSSLTPEEIKDILRNSSEKRGNPTEPDVSNRWNDKWGFGLVDASCAVDTVLDRNCSPLTGDGGVILPPDNDTSAGVEITSPDNGSWFVTDELLRIEGNLIENTGPWNDVNVRIVQYLEDFEEVVLLDWTTAGGEDDYWYLDVLIKDEWYDSEELNVVIEVKALGVDDLVSSDIRYGNIGKMVANFGSPSSGSTISGYTTFSGTAQGVNPDYLIYRVNSGEWLNAYSFDKEDFGPQDWSFTWDSTEVPDGSHKISIRLVNESGTESDITRRTFTVDNLPAAPELRFQGTVQVYDQDLPAQSAMAGTILEVHFGVVNTGDADASDLHLRLDAPGSTSNTYPSEGKLPQISEGETIQVKLWWWATEPGEHTVTLQIDPNGVTNDDQSDNEYTFTFMITERPIDPMLRFMTSAVTISPLIPTPNFGDSINSFTMNVRVDNLGQNDATNIRMSLYSWEDNWVPMESRTLMVVPGSSISSGYAKAQFSDSKDEAGIYRYRAVLEGTGVEAQYSEYRFTVIVDDYSVSSKNTIQLSDGEVILGFVGIPVKDGDSSDGGGLLFTTINGELHARTLTQSGSTPSDTLVEENWAGEFAFTLRDDERVQMAWTKRFEDQLGYTMVDVGMASIGMLGEMGSVSSHLNPLKSSEGKYWGLDLHSKGDEIVLAGYHRDIKTGGSWNDLTNVFMMYKDDYSSSAAWTTKMNVLIDIDIKPSEGNAIAVAIGSDDIHLLYQQIRDDGNGIERSGLFYAHGDISETPFGFQAPAGDYARNQDLEILRHEGEDILVAGWIEGVGRSTSVMAAAQNTIWSNDNTVNISAPGATKIVLYKTSSKEIKFLYDEIGVSSTGAKPYTRYGSYTAGDSEIGLSNNIAEGYIVGAGSIGYDAFIIMVDPSGQVTSKKLLFAGQKEESDEKNGFLDYLLAPLPGEGVEKLWILSGIGIFLFGLFLVVVVVLKRQSDEEEIEISAESGDLELLIETEEDFEEQSDDLVVTIGEAVLEEEPEELTLSEELEAKVEAGTGSKRLERRMKRKEEREAKEIFENITKNLPVPGALLPIVEEEEIVISSPDLPMPAPPSPAEMPLPPLPIPERIGKCGECGASVTIKDITIMTMNCPICSAQIKL